jgi:hypothetical protein
LYLLLSDQKSLYLERNHMKSITRSSALMALALAATVASTTAAHAASTPFVITPTSDGQLGFAGGGAAGPNIANTSTGGVLGYNFVYTSAATSKAPGAQGDSASGTAGNVAMDNATANDGPGYSFLALDADYEQSAVDVTLTLLANTTYNLTFDFAEDQQLWNGEPGNHIGSCGNSNPNCDANYSANLGVSVGTSASTANSSAAILSITGANQTAQSFGGWTAESLSFTTGSTGTEVLSFLANSPGSNVPAFSLVDNIAYSVAPNPTPEPSSLMLLGTGLAGLSGMLRSRFKKSAKV